MFKDYDKYLTVSLKMYLFLLIIVFVMKLMGLDYFGLDADNQLLVKLNEIMSRLKIKEIWYIFTLWLYAYFIISMVAGNKHVKLIALIATLINVMSILTVKYVMIKPLRSLFDIVILYAACFVASKQSFKTTMKKATFWIVMYTIFQMISMVTRKGDLIIVQDDFVSLFILNFDYILLMYISYKLCFMKGGIKSCGMVEAGSSLLKKIKLKSLLRKLHTSYLNFRKHDKETKLTVIIYYILSAIWNILTICIILFIAKLNNTLVECLFILTSFWLSKGMFGKAFHLSKITHCFVVSNLTYYTLNRITTPLGVSILIPIMLGVGLSYVTSKLVKTKYKPLYKGMPEDIFNDTILKVTDKHSIKYAICYDYFIKKQSALPLSYKYNYTHGSIKQIIYRINNEIKKLN